MNKIYLLLGSNIEPRKLFLEAALREIIKRTGKLVIASAIYESEPWGFEDGTPFLNRVILVKTKFEAEHVLEIILSIEKEMGRQRTENSYSSRNIDIDILYFNDIVAENQSLQIPHPRLHLRRFTLIPLVEIAPDFVHPVLQLSNNEILKKCEDPNEVTIFKAPGVEV